MPLRYGSVGGFILFHINKKHKRQTQQKQQKQEQQHTNKNNKNNKNNDSNTTNTHMNYIPENYHKKVPCPVLYPTDCTRYMLCMLQAAPPACEARYGTSRPTPSNGARNAMPNIANQLNATVALRCVARRRHHHRLRSDRLQHHHHHHHHHSTPNLPP